MIRILHIVHTMECGGIETMLMNIYRKIDRQDIQFDFLVNGTKNNYYTNEIEKLGGRVLNVTPKRESLTKNYRETINTIKNGNYDVVHIHQDSMIAFALYCAKKAGIKNIITHAHTTSANGLHRQILAKIGRTYINRNASLKLACSNAAAKWIYGEKVENYIIFKNAIDAKKFIYSEVNNKQNRESLGISDDSFVIGTCGRFSIEKNQIFLVKIFNEIKRINSNSKLILIGDGSEKENITQLCKELGVIEDVIFPGMVENVEFYYNILDAFVLPSFFEGLPLVGIEAQAAGVNCFFSDGVTKEISVTEQTKFMSLDKSAYEWAYEIVNTARIRKNNYESIRKAGYDVGENVKFLENTYKSFLNQEAMLSGEKK